MNFWDNKYKQAGFGYGIQPNQFFKQIIDNEKAGTLLLPGEGEGRNAIYAAKNRWNVSAFDSSKVAIEKAHNLAAKYNLTFNYFLSDIDKFQTKEKFDIIAIIYLHLVPEQRKSFHLRLMGMLKNNGKLIMEVFSKEQLTNNSGGPKDLNLLYSIEDLENDFSNFRIDHVEQLDVDLNEGSWHQGKANVIRMITSLSK
jgi:Methyltransferase domain